jgi:hypothetical protein
MNTTSELAFLLLTAIGMLASTLPDRLFIRYFVVVSVALGLGTLYAIVHLVVGT